MNEGLARAERVFRRDGRWYMVFIAFDGRGYETRLATSDDLLGRVFASFCIGK